jgi:hypothetical protein
MIGYRRAHGAEESTNCSAHGFIGIEDRMSYPVRASVLVERDERVLLLLIGSISLRSV